MAVDFSGSGQYYYYPLSPGTPSWSTTVKVMCCWFSPDSTGAYQRIMHSNEGNFGTNSFQLSIHSSGAVHGVAARGVPGTETQRCTTSSFLTAGKWYHAIAMCDGVTIGRLWVDGVAQTNTSSQDWSTGSNNNRLYIGARSDAGSLFNGRIAHAAYWTGCPVMTDDMAMRLYRNSDNPFMFAPNKLNVYAPLYAADQPALFLYEASDFTKTGTPTTAADHPRTIMPWSGFVPSVVSAGVTLSVNNITQGQTIDAALLTQAHQLSVADIEQGQLLGTTAMVQAHVIAPAGVDQAQTVGPVSLTQHGTLAVSGIEQAHSLEGVTLTQAHIIAVNDIDQSQAIGGVTLAQAGSIAPAGITQAQLIDATALAQANILSMNDVQQSQGIDGVALTVAGSLAIQAIVQAQSVDNVLLTQAGVLSIDDLTQEQIINSSSLIQYYQLAVQNLIQGQEASNITLSAAGLGLSIDGLLQTQVIGGAGLTEFAVLSVNDLAQSQIIDLANLGGLVVGCLSGNLVFYAKVGGQVVMYSLLDGVVT